MAFVLTLTAVLTQINVMCALTHAILLRDQSEAQALANRFIEVWERSVCIEKKLGSKTYACVYLWEWILPVSKPFFLKFFSPLL